MSSSSHINITSHLTLAPLLTQPYTTTHTIPQYATVCIASTPPISGIAPRTQQQRHMPMIPPITPIRLEPDLDLCPEPLTLKISSNVESQRPDEISRMLNGLPCRVECVDEVCVLLCLCLAVS
ncbi:hypothetical protein MRB53_036974 [Persea americana]|nr:hypothetical protein MRB53_036974 [Persea americana]